MFPHRYYPAVYYPPVYFSGVGADSPPPTNCGYFGHVYFPAVYFPPVYFAPPATVVLTSGGGSDAELFIRRRRLWPHWW